MSPGTLGPTSVNQRINRQRGKLYRPPSDRIPEHPLLLRMTKDEGVLRPSLQTRLIAIRA
ncbi:hypothetical protein S23_25050 [Bradyrhizobium cosmicum]|uniref:Uncharacterized protein n=1 Tax=Bradyrhizobium cosmicum TaxID=1404864 RepID=A0AAI8M916_9BRAD|nr:hypothetical protein S23_25050 [Bradyrhizobium cosmicum]